MILEGAVSIVGGKGIDLTPPLKILAQPTQLRAILSESAEAHADARPNNKNDEGRSVIDDSKFVRRSDVELLTRALAAQARAGLEGNTRAVEALRAVGSMVLAFRRELPRPVKAPAPQIEEPLQ